MVRELVDRKGKREGRREERKDHRLMGRKTDGKVQYQAGKGGDRKDWKMMDVSG